MDWMAVRSKELMMKDILKSVAWFMVSAILLAWYPILAIHYDWPYAKREVVLVVACVSISFGFFKGAESLSNIIYDTIDTLKAKFGHK